MGVGERLRRGETQTGLVLLGRVNPLPWERWSMFVLERHQKTKPSHTHLPQFPHTPKMGSNRITRQPSLPKSRGCCGRGINDPSWRLDRGTFGSLLLSAKRKALGLHDMR